MSQYASAKPGQAETKVNPNATHIDDTNLDKSGVTNPAAADFTYPSQRIHRNREVLHTEDRLPATVKEAHIEPFERASRAELQDEEKRRLQERGQGFAETGQL